VLKLTTEPVEGRKVYITASEIVVDPDSRFRGTQPVVLTLRWFSLVPPLLAIVLAIWLHNAILALFVAVWSGAVILSHGNFFNGFIHTIDTYLIGELAQIKDAQFDHSHLMIIFFTMFPGAMAGVMSISGGTTALVNRLARITTKREHGQLMTWGLELVIFFDDYANTLLVGSTMRPVTDRFRISREKLAFLVDSTAAPVSALAIVSIWVGLEIGSIGDTYTRLGLSDQVFDTFLYSLLYCFYPLYMIVFVWMIAYTGHDYGPMLKAEVRALSLGQLSRPGEAASSMEDDQLSGDRSKRIGAFGNSADRHRRWLMVDRRYRRRSGQSRSIAGGQAGRRKNSLDSFGLCKLQLDFISFIFCCVDRGRRRDVTFADHAGKHGRLGTRRKNHVSGDSHLGSGLGRGSNLRCRSFEHSRLYRRVVSGPGFRGVDADPSIFAGRRHILRHRKFLDDTGTADAAVHLADSLLTHRPKRRRSQSSVDVGDHRRHSGRFSFLQPLFLNLRFYGPLIGDDRLRSSRSRRYAVALRRFRGVGFAAVRVFAGRISVLTDCAAAVGADRIVYVCPILGAVLRHPCQTTFGRPRTGGSRHLRRSDSARRRACRRRPVRSSFIGAPTFQDRLEPPSSVDPDPPKDFQNRFGSHNISNRLDYRGYQDIRVGHRLAKDGLEAAFAIARSSESLFRWYAWIPAVLDVRRRRSRYAHS